MDEFVLPDEVRELADDYSAVRQAETQVVVFESYRNAVLTDGISKSTGYTIESLFPKTFKPLEMQRFTEIPSTTSVKVAVEALDKRRSAMIIALIAVGLTAMISLGKWIIDTVKAMYLKKEMDERATKRVLERLHQAALKAKALTPEEIKEKESSQKAMKLLDQNLYAHRTILNEGVRRIVDIGVRSNYTDKQIGTAVSNFKTVAIRLNITERAAIEFIRLYSILCNERNDVVSPVIAVIPNLDPSWNTLPVVAPMYIMALTTIVHGIFSVSEAVLGLCRMLCMQNIEPYMISNQIRTIELALYSLTSSKPSYIQGRIIDFDAVLELSPRGRDLKPIPARWDVNFSDKLSDLYERVRDLRGKRFSVWDTDSRRSSYEHVRLETYLPMAESLINGKGLEILTKFYQSTKVTSINLPGVREASELVRKQCQTIQQHMPAIKESTVIDMMFEFKHPTGTGIAELTPINAINRAISVCTKVQRHVASVFSIYTVLDGTVQAAMSALDEKATEYSKSMDKY